MTDSTPRKQQIQAVISALEDLRPKLGDFAVGIAVAALIENLAHEASDVEVAAAEPQQLKQVTVLFVDVVESTRLGERLDPEDFSTVMDGALARFTYEVQAHGGRALQYAGDCLLAAFGTPLAFEDDAERAVRAGLAIIAEAARYADEMADRFGLDSFSVRVGAHSGDVLLGGGVDGANTIRGLSVAIAARMQQTAPVGGLRISQDCCRLLRSRFVLDAQPLISVKGVAEPMVTYLVRTSDEHHAAAPAGAALPPMLGREGDLAILVALLAEADAASQLIAAMLIGDAGIGKSRLVAECRGRAQALEVPLRWLAVDCSEAARSRPYGILRAILCAGLGLPLEISPIDREAFVSAVVKARVELASAGVLATLLGFDGTGRTDATEPAADARRLRDRAFFHAAQLLHAWAGDGQGLVVAIDDLHWCDDGSLAFFEHLIRAEADLALLLLLSARPTLAQRWPGWERLTPTGGWRRIDLDALDDAAMTAIAQVRLTPLLHEPLAAPLCAELVGSSDGNPFHLRERINLMIDRGALASVGDGAPWRLDPARMLNSPLPLTLVGVLQARLDALEGPARRCAQVASVIGVQFWDQALTALAPLPEAAVDALTRRLIAAEQGVSRFPGLREFLFANQSLQQVVYRSVLKHQRRDWHARAAHWLVSCASDPPLEAIAEHFERGGEAELAADYWHRAAVDAAARFLNDQALAAIERALALLTEADLPRRLALARLRCEILEAGYDLARREQALATLQELAEFAAQPGWRSVCLRLRSLCSTAAGHHAEALAQARQSLAALPPDVIADRAATRLRVAQCLSRLGQNAAAEAEAGAALAEARLAGDLRAEGGALNELGILADDRGDIAAARRHYEQALLPQQAASRTNSVAATQCNLGYLAMSVGDHDEAEARYAAASAVFTAIGDQRLLGLTEVNLAMARLNQSRADDAAAIARTAVARLRRSADTWAEATALRVLGLASTHLGRHGEAREQLLAAQALFIQAGTPQLAAEAGAALAWCELGTGNTVAALRAFDHALAVFGAEIDAADDARLEGTEEPMRVRQIGCAVLADAGDARAADWLAHSHRHLQARAARIADPALRHSYLERVPYNRAILHAWRAGGADPAAPASASSSD
jgi:predicted ATPase/class 3 adenylate cyclase